jgi:hypothetical protein
MATKKAARTGKAVLSKGTVISAKYRAASNGLSDQERQRLRASAMSAIYGKNDGPKVNARSR